MSTCSVILIRSLRTIFERRFQSKVQSGRRYEITLNNNNDRYYFYNGRALRVTSTPACRPPGRKRVCGTTTALPTRRVPIITTDDSALLKIYIADRSRARPSLRLYRKPFRKMFLKRRKIFGYKKTEFFFSIANAPPPNHVRLRDDDVDGHARAHWRTTTRRRLLNERAAEAAAAAAVGGRRSAPNVREYSLRVDKNERNIFFIIIIIIPPADYNYVVKAFCFLLLHKKFEIN